jgi:hypothetical protein
MKARPEQHETTHDAGHEQVGSAAAPAQVLPGPVRRDTPLNPSQVRALQRTAGNAVVAGLLVADRAPRLTRQAVPAAAPAPAAADRHKVTPADKTVLDNAKQLIDKAKVNKDGALKALSQYASQAPGHLAALKGNADKDLEQYKRVTQHVNYIISEAKEMAKIQDDVLMTIVGEALGGLGPILGHISGELAEKYESLKKAWEEAKEEFKLDEIYDKVKEAGGGEAPGEPVGDVAGKELEFYKLYSELQSHSTSILGVGVTIGKLSEPIGKVEDAIAGITDSGQTRGDYPLDKIQHEAAVLESSSRSLSAAASPITNMLGELKGTVDQAKASSPKDDKEAEKQIWKHWAASLREGTDFKTLDLDPIENYLKKIGIWKELGIDIGMWFSSEEQILAVGSARAQELVMNHREPVIFQPSAFPKVRMDGIPGASEFSAHLDASSTVFSSKVRAVVIGAETVGAEGALDTDILKQIGRNKDGSYNADLIAEYLIRNGYVRVILRGYEDLSQENAVPEGGVPGGSEPGGEATPGNPSSP